tara:strand:+ start:674 stop:1234 length:561 start_codon:yes stop_codon:yes gene_type:complete
MAFEFKHSLCDDICDKINRIVVNDLIKEMQKKIEGYDIFGSIVRLIMKNNLFTFISLTQKTKIQILNNNIGDNKIINCRELSDYGIIDILINMMEKEMKEGNYEITKNQLMFALKYKVTGECTLTPSPFRFYYDFTSNEVIRWVLGIHIIQYIRPNKKGDRYEDIDNLENYKQVNNKLLKDIHKIL